MTNSKTTPSRKQLNCLWKLCKLYGNNNTDWYKLGFDSKTLKRKEASTIIDMFKKWESEPLNMTLKDDLCLLMEVYIEGFTIINNPKPAEPIPAPEVTEPEVVQPENGARDLSQIIAQEIEKHLNVNAPATDFEKIREYVNELVSEKLKNKVHEVIVKKPDGKTVKIDKAHYLIEPIMKLIARRKHVWLTGPSGSGKSYAAAQIAKALGLKFAYKAVGIQTSQSDIIGYNDGKGNYVATDLYRCYKDGGLFLLDEVDAGNPNVLTVLNNMLSNGRASFPCGMVDMHEDFVCMAAANTYGRGADRVYVGRCPIDGASRDRFRFLDFDYDENLERELSANGKWVDRVQAIRKAVFDLKEEVIVSPRASIEGSEDIEDGFTFEQCENMLIWKGLNPEIKNRIIARVERN